MPNFADDEGRYWWAPSGEHWLNQEEIPHPPTSVRSGCACEFCRHHWRQAPDKEQRAHVRARVEELKRQIRVLREEKSRLETFLKRKRAR